MIYLGCDSGKKGSICLYNTDTGSIGFIDLTQNNLWDTIMYLRKLKKHNDIKAMLEKVRAISGSGSTGTFQFGFNYAISVLCLELSDIEYDTVTAQVWQRKFAIKGKKGLTPYHRKKDIKVQVATIMSKLYPDAKERYYTPRNALIDGRSDATAIMHYGFLKFNNGITNMKDKSTKELKAINKRLVALEEAMKALQQKVNTTSTSASSGTGLTGDLITPTGEPITTKDELVAAAKGLGLKFRSDISGPTLEKRYRAAFKPADTNDDNDDNDGTEETEPKAKKGKKKKNKKKDGKKKKKSKKKNKKKGKKKK